MKDITFFKTLISVILVCGIVFGSLYIFTAQKNKKLSEYYYFHAKDSYARGSTTSAVSEVNEAIRLHKDARYYFFKYQIYSRLEKINLAFYNLEQAIKYDKNNAEYYFLLGIFNCNYGSRSKALECYKKAVELAPNNTEYKATYATYLSFTTDIDTAIKLFEEVLAVDPTYDFAWNNLAYCYYAKGDNKTRFK